MPTLALSMIVKNEEKTLARCLDSVRGVADEIVIGDTGSTDRSIEIARQYGANVFLIPWEDDFAKARNRSLARATSDWVLMMDSDEMLDPDAAKALPGHLAAAQVMGYTVAIRNYVHDLSFFMWDQRAKPNEDKRAFVKDYAGYVDHVNTRLFRRHPQIYFQGRVHESVGYRLCELGMRIDHAEFLIHHFGFLDRQDVQTGKAQLYRRLGREKVQDMPENSLAYFELGVEEALHFQNYQDATGHFRKSAQLNPRFGPAWLYYGKMLATTGKHREALEAYARTEDTAVNRAMVLESQGDSYYAVGEFAAARRCYEQLVELDGDKPAIASKIGIVEVRLGLTEQGLLRLEGATSAAPEDVEAHDRLIAAHVWLGCLDDAAEAAERKLEFVEPRPEFFLRAASVHARLRRWDRALDLVRRGLQQFPGDETLLAAIAEARKQLAIDEAAAQGDSSFRVGDYAAARRYYGETLDRLGDSPIVESKLGIAEVRSGHMEQGLARLREAVRKLPQAAEILDRYIAACFEAGRMEEAAEAAERKLDDADPRPDHYLLAAGLNVKVRNSQRAAEILQFGLERFPKDEKLRELYTGIQHGFPST